MKQKAFFIVPLLAAMLLSGCGGPSGEQLAAREDGISRLNSGDYAGALEAFEALIADASRVTAFEIDVLKYRAEAEYRLCDYAAASYTYGILNQVDRERAEYCYLSALCLAKDGDSEAAKEQLESGKRLDQSMEAPGYTEAMEAVGTALLETGNRNEADAVFRELIASGKATTAVFNQRMLSEMENENYEEALEVFSQSRAASDHAAEKELRFNEAVCYEYLGRYAEARQKFQEYTAEFGSDAKAEHEIAFLVTREQE